MGRMQVHTRRVFTQPILIVIVILLVLVGFGASRLIDAQTAATANPTGSSTTTRPLTVMNSTPPVPGMVNAKIDCAELSARDFSKIPDAATKITSATVVAASANSSQTCKIAGITAPKANFIVQLPVKHWNGDYFQGGCGGLCGFAS
jgi:hypothetical protein